MLYYNSELKLKFIDMIIKSKKLTYRQFNKLFQTTKKFEELLEKDLYSFSSDELLSVFKQIAENLKYTTVSSYNSLIKDYKQWASILNISDVIINVCTTKELKTINNFKQYTIVNDEDIENLTGRNAFIDGADFVPLIFIRIFWEIDGKEKAENILRIKISDLNVEKNTLKINHVIYSISEYLTALIYNYANMDSIEYSNKGNYKMFTASQNKGVILRSYISAKTLNNIGVPYKLSRISNILYTFGERNDIEGISVNDLSMSLALRYMLKNKKSHTDMYNERIYFSSMPSAVYKDVFSKYAEEKFPTLYHEYEIFVESLRESR